MLSTRLSPPATDSEEWRLRRELTDFYHLIDFLGWTEMIFNHISVRLPGTAHHYLVNPFGLNYTEITPENLLKVGVDGRLVEPSEYPANPAGFALHGAIHESLYAATLFGRVGYHDFEGITLYADERGRMLASLGDKHVLVLRNHGIAVCERDIPTTFALLWTVQRAAEIQCQAAALGGEDIALSEAIQRRCRDAVTDLGSGIRVARLMFDATVRRMRSHS